MAETIDQVQVEVTATAKGTSAVFGQLESQLSTLKTALGALDTSKLKAVSKASKSLGIDTSGMTKAEKEVSDRVNSIKEQLAGLKSLKDAALGGDSSSLTSFNRRVTAIQGDIDRLSEKLRQLDDNRTGINIDTDAFQTYRSELVDIQNTLTDTQNQVQNTVSTMNSAKPDVDTGDLSSRLSEIKDKALSAASSLLKMTASGIKSGFTGLKSGISKIGDTISKVNTKAQSLASTGFMKILKYGLGIRSLYVLFRRLRTAITDSFSALKSSGAMFETTRSNIDSLKNSLSTLKFQFGAAFEPIFNLVAPALQSFINYLVSAINTISALIARLSGRSTYSKVSAVLNNVGSSAGGASDSVKDLNKQLQSFDELNNLSLDNNSSGGGGGGGGGSGDSALYETANVDDALGDFAKELAEKIEAGDWYGLGRTISDKLSEVMESIPWDSIYQKAKNFGKGLAEFLNGLITPRLFGDLGKTIASAINTAFYFLNSFGKTFDWTNFGNSIATGINEFFRTADFKEWGDTVHTWVGGILDAGITLLEDTDFKLIGQKLGEFLENIKVDDLLGKVKTLCSRLITAIGNTLTGFKNNTSEKTKIIAGLGAILTNLALTKNIPLTIAFAVTIGGAYLGEKYYEWASGNKVDQSFIDELQDIWTGVFEDRPLSFDVAEAVEFVISDLSGKNNPSLSPAQYSLATLISTSFGPAWFTANYGKIVFGLKDVIEFKWNSFSASEQSVIKSISPLQATIKDALVTVFSPAWFIAQYGKILFNIADLIKVELPNVTEFISNTGIGKTIKSIKESITNLLNGTDSTSHGYNGAPSEVASMLDEQNSAKQWNNIGENIVKGIAQGIKLSLQSNPFTAPVVAIYTAIKNAIADKFEMHSPAKAMYEDGENIFMGIIKGFIKALNSYNFDDLIQKLKSKFSLKDLFSGSASTVTGIGLDTFNLVQGNQEQTITINTKLKGAVTSKKGFESINTVLNNIKTKYTNMQSNLKTNMKGEATSQKDLDNIRTKYEALSKAWVDKESTLSATPGGHLKKIDDLDTWRGKFKNLYTAWTGKSVNMNANTTTQGNSDGNLSKFESWKKKLNEFKDNTWIGKDIAFGAFIGGQLNSIEGLTAGSTWAKTLNKFKNSIWLGSNATFGLDISDATDNNPYVKDRKNKLMSLWNWWTGQTNVTFGLDIADASDNNPYVKDRKNKLMDLWNWWTGTRTVTFTADFQTTNTESVAAATGGAVGPNGSLYRIPQFAGGTLDAGSVFIAGEAGPEVMGHINGRTEILNRSQMASVMNNAFVSAMSRFGSRLLTSPKTLEMRKSVYNGYNTDNNGNNDYLLSEQNALLREQNSLLRTISEKNLTIDSRDVFSATRSEANNYYKRTGNSPFLM